MHAVEVKRLNILVADDQASNATTVEFVLKQAGHNVAIVRDGSDALSAIMASPDQFDLLITDHAMKQMDGLELVKALQGKSFGGGILVLSAYLTSSVRRAYQSLGVKHFMDKPFELDELREAVNAVSK